MHTCVHACCMRTVEEFDDVGEVHVVIDDDLAVVFDEGEGDEQHKVGRADVSRHPDRLPHGEHIIVEQLCTDKHYLYNTIQHNDKIAIYNFHYN